MNEETLIHAAKRIIRFIRIDDTKHGGLLSQETVKAAEMLNLAVQREARNGDAQS